MLWPRTQLDRTPHHAFCHYTDGSTTLKATAKANPTVVQSLQKQLVAYAANHYTGAPSLCLDVCSLVLRVETMVGGARVPRLQHTATIHAPPIGMTSPPLAICCRHSNWYDVNHQQRCSRHSYCSTTEKICYSGSDYQEWSTCTLLTQLLYYH
jgi:hypothetical protein